MKKAEPAPEGIADVLAELRAIRQQLGAQTAAVLNREAPRPTWGFRRRRWSD